ncbi:MAG: hypothetical protein OQJ81_09750, partial [Melioribacteraceae bacterium]|nr:hypothetical protein [Melioribacteraceae bacterium]
MLYRLNQYIFGLIIITSISFAQNVEITNTIVVGGVSSSSARFWVRTSVPSKVNIEFAEVNNFTGSNISDEITTT